MYSVHTQKRSVMYRDSKDGVTVLTILDTRRTKQSGLYPVKVQVVYKRVQKYYTTGKELSPDEWKKLPETRAAQLSQVRNSIKNSYDLVWKNAEELAAKGRIYVRCSQCAVEPGVRRDGQYCVSNENRNVEKRGTGRNDVVL